jgi:hypothetical protein
MNNAEKIKKNEQEHLNTSFVFSFVGVVRVIRGRSIPKQ